MPRDRVDLELKNSRAFDILSIEYRVVIIILNVKYFPIKGKLRDARYIPILKNLIEV